MKQTKSRRLWQAALLVVFFLTAGFFVGDSVSLASAPEGVRDGVAVVAEYGRVKSTNTYRLLSWGSSFFVGNPSENPQFLVTNYHVIADYDQLGGGERVSVYDENGVEYDKLLLRVYFDSDEYVEAYPKEVNVKMDVAVLYLEHPTDKRKALPIKEPQESDVGAAVYAYGFPGIADSDFTDAVSEWGTSDITITSGIVSRLATESGTGVRQVQTDTEFWHGNSGGPLVNEDGVVIGITSSGVKSTTIKRDGSIDIEEVKYAVSMAEVVPLLDRNNISYSNAASAAQPENGQTEPNAEQQGEEGQSDNTLLIILIASGGGVVVIIIIILIIVLSKKKKPSTPPPAPQMNMPPPPMGGMNPPPQQQPQQAPPGDRNVSVQATSGMLAGRTFTAGPDGRITFGRQPSCQVVFGANDKNVSGNHCVVFKKNGNIILMDIGSTNGTFLENGTKLQPNIEYPMNPGDRFYLVNSDYVFKVW